MVTSHMVVTFYDSCRMTHSLWLMNRKKSPYGLYNKLRQLRIYIFGVMKLNGTYAEQAMALLGADCNLASDRTKDRRKLYDR